eukprot:2793589-Pleurochrysis_carterae.AAC.2
MQKGKPETFGKGASRCYQVRINVQADEHKGCLLGDKAHGERIRRACMAAKDATPRKRERKSGGK